MVVVGLEVGEFGKVVGDCMMMVGLVVGEFGEVVGD